MSAQASGVTTLAKIVELEEASKAINKWSDESEILMRQLADGEYPTVNPEIDEELFEKVWELLAEIAPETARYLETFVEG